MAHYMHEMFVSTLALPPTPESVMRSLARDVAETYGVKVTVRTDWPDGSHHTTEIDRRNADRKEG